VGEPVSALADEIDRTVRGLEPATVESMRRVRREFSRQIQDWPGDQAVALALALVGRQRWVAYELLYHHPAGVPSLDTATVEQLGDGLDSWGAVDAFGRYISGPAWRANRITDDLIRDWATTGNRWWRRAALVSTVPLNLRAAGGTGDAPRTLAVCTLLMDDRDDLVVKALSWALRELVWWDPAAVRAFLDEHPGLAARVRREVTAKLDTGRKVTRRD
jgi:3-methyladenine DNA glycosylase AlkD